VTVDVETRRVYAAAIGLDAEFPLDVHTQHRLLEGLDDIGLTLQHADSISAYEQTRPAWMPTLSA
jgi:3-isopropylmalate/(R)-2-methylmalate dehydratase small subunit